MIPDGDYTAVVIETEQGLVTLELTGHDGEDDSHQYRLVVAEDELPEAGSHVDAIVAVTLVDGDIVEAAYKPEETRKRGEDAQRRFDRLSKRPPSDRDQ